MSETMNRIRITVLLMPVLFILASCSKTPAPEATFTATINSNVVTFNASATNTTTYEWDFGDESRISAEEDPVHTYARFNQDYEVTLKVKGPGGEATVTNAVRIPPMTSLQMLSGADPVNGKKWCLSSSAPMYYTLPDTTFTVRHTFPAGYLNQIGFPSAYNDEYVFGIGGSFIVNLKGNGIIGGLSYCISKGIPNVVPGHDAREANLTFITPYTVPPSMTYGFNEGKDLTISALKDGRSETVTFHRVTTLSLSYGGFIGIRDWMNEFIIKDFSDSSLTLVCFVSTVSSGKITGALILTFEPV